MKRLLWFLGQYKLFSLAISGLLAALALQILKQPTALHWELGTLAILELLPLLWTMWQDLRSGTYGLDVLAATAIVTAVLLGQYWAAVAVVAVLTGSEPLEDFARQRAKSPLGYLLKPAPRTANVTRNRKIMSVKVSELRVGDKIIINPGETVAVDAVIIEGATQVDESMVTGDSAPQTKHVKDQLRGGSVNLDETITAKALATVENSQYQHIIKLVRGASTSQAPFVRLADRYSLPFIFTAYAVAVAAWVVGGHPIRFLEVIIVATPGPLLLAAPIALLSGMSRAARHGIIVKTGTALEKLAEAQTIAFDKTGTLSRGELRVASIATYGDFTENEVLGLAASLEQNSNHQLAQAISQGAVEQKVKFSKAKHVQEIPHRGLLANVKGREVLVGRLSLLEEHAIALPAKFRAETIKSTAVYVAIGGELAGIILLDDALRPDSTATLKRLRRLGIGNSLLVTGDNAVVSRAIAKQLGIRDVRAELLPAGKLHALDGVTSRPLAFVGNDVHDAPALTAADVGIVLGARGETAASESADIVILLDNLSLVATARSIANRTFGVAKQTILVGIGLSLALMLAFATGKFPPLAGAILQSFVVVFVVFNALRARGGKLA